MDAAWVGVVGVLLGAIVGAVTAEVRASREDERARSREKDARLIAWYQARIDDTRRYMAGQLHVLETRADGDAAALADAKAVYKGGGMASTSLIGDRDLIERWFDLVRVLQDINEGDGVPDEIRIEVLKVTDALILALDQQEQRVLRGDPVNVPMPGPGEEE